MHYSDDLFPFRSVLSLEPLIDYWKEIAQGEHKIRASLAAHVLSELEAAPELRGEIADLSLFEKNHELVELLMSIILPFGSSDQTYAAAILPFKPVQFFATPAFERENILKHLLEYFSMQGDFMSRGKAVKSYVHLLEEYYDNCSETKVPMFFPATDEQTGLTRYFKIDWDTRFTRIKNLGPVPELDEHEIAELMSDIMNLDLWKEKLPPENFEYYGFTVLSAVEVTEGQILSALKNDLLQKDALNTPAKIEQIQSKVRSYLRMPDIELGLVSIARGEFNKISNIHPLGRSLLLSKGVAPDCPMWQKSLYAGVSDGRRDAIFIQDLKAFEHKTGFERYLVDQGYNNLLLAPLHYEDELVGILELASPNVNDLNRYSVTKLQEINSLFAIAIHRGLEELEDRVQAIIKEQYTSIHPAVEWRFRDAALDYLHNEQAGSPAQADSIVFQDVYPLYGLSDIRGSSEMRNIAIQADLIEQLNLAHAVLIESQKYWPLHVIDEMSYRLGSFVAEVDEELRSGDEINILNFLREEVEPLFDELAQYGPDVQVAIDKYRIAVDSELGILYKKRKEYEKSVRLINDTIGAYIEKKEVEAQQMYPHFFEMFKTDGVDYNIYVGASLVEKRTYDPLYLRNLRIWQLMLMCGIQWEMDRLIPGLKVPLHVAHLILVQDLPLSIRFRVDEKKFDVDGAYNIRYEIVKKRIDKARIQGTRERLTQPGKIAIVYSQDEEAQEYRRYIKYMQASGFFDELLEDVTLEDLQGVHGLRALRVGIKPGAHMSIDGPTTSLQALAPGDGAGQSPFSINIELPESIN